MRATVGSSGVATATSDFVARTGSPTFKPPKRACEPSQKGGFALALHWHKKAVSDVLAINFCGVKFVPLCEPSQKGCVIERPQAHQK